MLGPLTLDPILDRLRDQLDNEWREIGGAGNLREAEELKFAAVPAAYVLLASDQPSPPAGSSQRVIQRVIGSWGVLIAVSDYRRSSRGTGNADELAERIRLVRAAMIGWKHPAGNGTSTRLGGNCRFLGRRGSTVIWQDIYSAEYHIRT